MRVKNQNEKAIECESCEGICTCITIKLTTDESVAIRALATREAVEARDRAGYFEREGLGAFEHEARRSAEVYSTVGRKIMAEWQR